MSEEPTQSAMVGAIPVLGGGVAITAASSSFDGTLQKAAVVSGVVLILTGLMIFALGVRQWRRDRRAS